MVKLIKYVIRKVDLVEFFKVQDRLIYKKMIFKYPLSILYLEKDMNRREMNDKCDK